MEALAAHAYNPSTPEAVNSCKNKDTLVYRASSRTVRDTQRNPISKRGGGPWRDGITAAKLS